MNGISIVIPARNAEATLDRALQSVLAQEQLPDEVIVVDNGSSDRTQEIARSHGGRIRCVIPPPPFGGPSSSRNFGIQCATGEWVAILDADDEWFPNRLLEQLKIVKDHPEVAWLAGDYESLVPHRGPKQLGLSRFMPNQACVIDDALVLMATPNRWSGDTIWTGTVLVRRDALNAVTVGQNWFDPNQTTSHDLDLWLRLAMRFPRIGYVSKPIARYVQLRPDTMTSRDITACDLSSLRLMDRAIELAGNITAHRRTAVMKTLGNLALLLCRNSIAVGNLDHARTLIGEYRKRGIHVPLAVRLTSLLPTKVVKLVQHVRRHRQETLQQQAASWPARLVVDDFPVDAVR